MLYCELSSKGGHFAAFEKPDAFSEDVRLLVYKVDKLCQKSAENACYWINAPHENKELL